MTDLLKRLRRRSSSRQGQDVGARVTEYSGYRLRHMLNTLEIIADFPITDRSNNQDAANMALIAQQALRAIGQRPV